MAGRPTRNQQISILERRKKVAQLRARGFAQNQIAAELGLPPGSASQVMVSKDLRAIRKHWQDDAARDFDTARAQQLAKLGELERELWAAWERSKSEVVESKLVRQLRRKVLDGQDEGDGPPRDPSLPAETVTEEVGRRKERSRKQRDANPAFAVALLHVIQEEDELYGLKVKDTSPSTSPPVVAFDVKEASAGDAEDDEDHSGAEDGGPGGAISSVPEASSAAAGSEAGRPPAQSSTEGGGA